jgi:hypothetical protein
MVDENFEITRMRKGVRGTKRIKEKKGEEVKMRKMTQTVEFQSMFSLVINEYDKIEQQNCATDKLMCYLFYLRVMC